MNGMDEIAGALAAPGSLMEPVVKVVIEAGALLRAELHRPEGPRGSGSHAAIDREIDEFLRDRLLALHDAGWLSEEGDRILSRSPDVWVVDPHDGTHAFVQKLRGSSISVALLRHGQPVLGVVYAPLCPDDRGDLICWAEDELLTRNGVESQRSRNAVNPSRPIVAMNEVSGDFARVNTEKLAPARFLAIPSIAYRLALAAVGDVDAAIAIGDIAPWDVAGGHAVLRGSDRAMTDIRGRPVTYDEGSTIGGCIGGVPDVVLTLAKRDLSGVTGEKRAPRHPARPRHRTQLAGHLSRAQGVLLGQFAGDALGSAVEFRSARDIALQFPCGLTDPIDGGTWNTIAGQPTDDSELALALARSIVEQRGFDATEVGRAYVRWLESGPFDIGGTIGASINALKQGKRATSASQANGALMRVSPIGILHAGNPVSAARAAAEDTALTHPSEVCRTASAAFAAAIAAGVAGADRESMWASAYAACGSGGGADIVRARLLHARSGPPSDFERQQGWVLTALQNAFFRLVRGTRVADAVRETVAQGGDTDTNGAICGALIGAADGREGIPLIWRNLVLSCRPVTGLGHRRPRPMEYWTDDALDLAEALLVAGQVQECRKTGRERAVPAIREAGPDLGQRAKYRVRIEDQSVEADTLGALLVGVLRSLEKRNPGTLETLSTITRRKRRLVARRKTDLYPGNPHLADYALPVNETWYVGTNYSAADVEAILLHAAVASGLGRALALERRGSGKSPTLSDL